jgi:hypothetical protein
MMQRQRRIVLAGMQKRNIRFSHGFELRPPPLDGED